MRWLPVFKKEMRLYFGSPVAYAVATFFLFIAAFFFAPAFIQYADISMRSAMQPQMGQNLNATENILRPLTYNMAVVLLFFIPMLTMRLFAEEKRSGTIELLLTSPVTDVEIILGKFFGVPPGPGLAGSAAARRGLRRLHVGQGLGQSGCFNGQLTAHGTGQRGGDVLVVATHHVAVATLTIHCAILA